jgi:hypothetical protein
MVIAQVLAAPWRALATALAPIREVIMVVMVPAADFHRESSIRRPSPLGTRDEVLVRYRQLRAITKHHHDKILSLVSTSAMLQRARRLGLSDGKRLFLDGISAFDLVSDLLVYTAPAGRSRALDRFARNSPPVAGSDEALMLDAMRKARFAVLIARSRHPAAGLIFTDLFRHEDIWLVDEGLEASLKIGTAYATRYCTPEKFSMTTGVGMPIYRDLLTEAVEAYAPQLTRKSAGQVTDDPRLAEAIYRKAIEEGVMETVAYVDPPAEGYAA